MALYAVDSKCGTGGGGDGSSSGEIEAIQPVVHPLSDAWNIDPSELAVCELADGKDWLLGTGSFGASSLYRPPQQPLKQAFLVFGNSLQPECWHESGPRSH